LAPPDFFLFGDAKRRFSGCSFDNTDELLGGIHDILVVFETETLTRACCEWMTKLHQSIDMTGEYLNKESLFIHFDSVDLMILKGGRDTLSDPRRIGQWRTFN
jgi:hypothetical protein